MFAALRVDSFVALNVVFLPRSVLGITNNADERDYGGRGEKLADNVPAGDTNLRT